MFECDIWFGGCWCFIYIVFDGMIYDNCMVFLWIEVLKLIEIEYGLDKDDDLGCFYVIIIFDE